MKYYGKSKRVAEQIVERFRAGEIAEPLATVFIKINDSRPMRKWSIGNQLMVLFSGHSDSRGYKQWQEVGRVVRKGEKANAWILIPYIRKGEDKKSGDEYTYISGFGTSAVFDISQTDGEPLEIEETHQELIDNLPLLEVAQAWDIDISLFNGNGSSYAGMFASSEMGMAIALGIENQNTFLHELMHAAEEKLDNLFGDKWLNEAVAQLGASTLAHMAGHAEIADEGKTFQYIQHHAEKAGVETITACTRALNRVSAAIQEIMAELDKCEGVTVL